KREKGCGEAADYDAIPSRELPPSSIYQMRKFARRNRIVVGGFAATLLALAGGIIGTALQLVRALAAETAQRRLAQSEQSARERADAKRILAERASNFMSEIFGGVHPAVAGSRDTTVLKELMDGAATRIEDGELKDAPEAELALRLTISGVYREIAEYQRAM